MSATTGRRALTAGPLVPAGVLAVTVPGGLLTRVLMPGASGTVRALVVTAVLTGVALAVRPCFGPWAAPGGDRPRTWWRAPVLVPLLAPLGPARGVLVGSALFGWHPRQRPLPRQRRAGPVGEDVVLLCLGTVLLVRESRAARTARTVGTRPTGDGASGEQATGSGPRRPASTLG